MANLSNINGKFVVDTAGNIGVGTLIPRSDANTTNISIQSSGTARLFVNNTGASGKEYAIYSSANGDFGIFDYGAVSARLVIDSSGNSTFAGKVSATATATNAAFKLLVDDSRIEFANSATYFQGGGNLTLQAAGIISIGTGGVGALLIDTSQNSTFAGTVLIDGVSNYTGLEVKGAGASRPQIKFSNANQGTLAQIYGTESNSLVTTVPAGLEYQVRNANGASGDHVFKSYNTAILTLNGGTNAATFSGNVKVNLTSSVAGALSVFDADGNTIWLTGRSSDGESSVSFRNNADSAYNGRIATTDTYMSFSQASNYNFDGNLNIGTAGDLYINSGTSYNNIGSVFLSNQRTEINSIIVDGTAQGDTALNFKTRSAGSTASAMFIDEFRNVGIGTDSPGSKLEVKDSQDSSLFSGLVVERSANTTAVCLNAVGGALNLNTNYSMPLKFRIQDTSMQTINTDGGRAYAANASGLNMKEYGYNFTAASGVTVDLIENSSAYSDIAMVQISITAYHSSRSFFAGMGTFGGYGFHITGAGSGLAFGGLTSTTTATGKRKLQWHNGSAYDATVRLYIQVRTESGITVLNGTLSSL
jgi:hypothetical protein